jgi:DNA-binding MarR family transcriptional regulator
MSSLRSSGRSQKLRSEDYRLLARFRHTLQQFFVFSEQSAKKVGVTVQQHRAVLSIKAFDGEATVGDLARDLIIKHHSAVGLADRLVRAGLVSRNSDPVDRRRVTLALTPRGCWRTWSADLKKKARPLQTGLSAIAGAPRSDR